MLRKIINNFTPIIYVQIWENRIRVINTKNGDSFDEKPFVLIEEQVPGKKAIKAIGNDAQHPKSSAEQAINPFSHPRVLLANFFVAEKLLQHAVHTLLGKLFLSPAPTIIMHPMEKLEGGLTMIEERAFRELALGAGGYEVYIHVGSELDIEKIDLKSLESRI